jgi:hypothetical protein
VNQTLRISRMTGCKHHDARLMEPTDFVVHTAERAMQTLDEELRLGRVKTEQRAQLSCREIGHGRRLQAMYGKAPQHSIYRPITDTGDLVQS